MGKKIDIAFLTLLGGALLYLYFLRAFDNRVFSLGAALLCLMLVIKLANRLHALVISNRFFRKKKLQRQASGAIMELACGDLEDSEKRIRAMVEQHYESTLPIVLIQAHPASKLSQNQIFDAWKNNRGQAELVVCATCGCDADVRAMASTLRKPRVAILGAEELKRLIAETPGDWHAAEAPKQRISFAAMCIRRHMLERRNAPRCALIACSCIAMYIFGRNIFYLIAAMILFFIAMLCVRRKRIPAKLF